MQSRYTSKWCELPKCGKEFVVKLICKHCGLLFTTMHAEDFCSGECEYDHRTQSKTAECVCGNPVDPEFFDDWNNEYCSAECLSKYGAFEINEDLN